jgi:hypothetical protein
VPYVVDHFQGPSYCPFGTAFERRTLRMVRELPEAEMRVHRIESRADVIKYGTTSARVYINGQEPADDPTVSDEEIRKAIEALRRD